MAENRGHCWDDVVGPRERLVASSYGTDRPLGRRPALLLIDLYEQVFGDRRRPLEEAIERFPATCGEAAWDALPALEALLATARELGLPVAHCTGEDRPESRPGGATRRREDRKDASAQGLTIVEPLRPRPGEFVVHKTRASAFFGTPLQSWLRMQDVDSLVVGGESTSGCVRASVVDAYSNGFATIVCEEAVFDRSPLSHKVSLFDLHLKYASVAHLEDAQAYLRSCAAQGPVTEEREVAMRT